MAEKETEITVWPPPVENQEKAPATQPLLWSMSALFLGLVAGVTLYIISYLVLVLVVLKFIVDIVENHKSWTLLYHLSGGLIYAAPIINLLWPGLIFLFSRKRNIGFAVGVFCGGIATMLIVVNIVSGLTKEFPWAIAAGPVN